MCSSAATTTGPVASTPAAPTEAVEALVPAFVLSALPRPVTRWFPLATRLARGPAFWFGHAADESVRLARAGELLAATADALPG